MSDERGNDGKVGQPTRMPKDFWQMVLAERNRAKAEVVKKRERVYQTYFTDEVKTGKRIAMPGDFWQAVEGTLDDNPTVEETLAEKGAPSYPEIDFQHQTQAIDDLTEQSEPYYQEILVEENLSEYQLDVVDSTETWPEVTAIAEQSQDFSLILDDDYSSRTKGMSFKEAALIILKRECREMTAREIVHMALQEGLLSSLGKTPDASLAGQIYTDIHRNRERSPFVIVGPRTYAVKAGLAEQTDQHIAKVVAGNFPIQHHKETIIEPVTVENSYTSQNTKENKVSYRPEDKKMSYKQAAMILLKRARKPLTAREIVTLAIKEGLIESTGKTPDATLAGQIHTDIQRLGERAPVKIIGPRTYALAEWYKK